MTQQDGTTKSGWRQDPEMVKADILDVATSVFAAHGFAGARIDEIVRRTKTSKRMIYYYFGSKDGLYLSVLEAAYTQLRGAEQALNLEQLPPQEALAQLIGFSFDYHRQHPDYIRLIAGENMHDGRHLKQSETIPTLNSKIIKSLERICGAGIEQGLFRPDLNAIELHWTISAICVFNVSNAATFSHLYGDALFTEAGQTALKARITEMILATTRPAAPPVA